MDLSLQAVIEGKVDAGITAVVPLNKALPEITAQIRILAETPPQPSPVISVRNDLDPTLREEIAEALLALNESQEGKTILSALGWPGLIRVSDADYDVTRAFAKKLGLEY